MYSRAVLLLVSLLILIMFESRIDGTITKFVNPNANVKFNCTYNSLADKMRWSFKKEDSDIWGIVFDARTQPNPEVECNADQKYCSIVVSNIDSSKAGGYRFEHGINGEQLTIACRYELIVGELQCQSSLRHSGIMIGENECPVKPETFERSCAFSYFGSYNYTPLNFMWMKSPSSESIFRDKLLKGSDLKFEKGKKISIVNDSVQVSNDMDKKVFECHLEGENQIQPCKLPRILVQYMNYTSKEKLQLKSDNLQSVNCSIPICQGLECKYHWEVQTEDVKFEIHEQNLTEKHLIAPGSYVCLVRCDFITGERCQITGRSFDLLSLGRVEDQQTGHKNGFVIAFAISFCLMLLLLIATISLILMIKRLMQIFKIFQLKMASSQENNCLTPNTKLDGILDKYLIGAVRPDGEDYQAMVSLESKVKVDSIT